VKYSGSYQIVLDFQKLLGDQMLSLKAIEMNVTNVLRVYKEGDIKVLQGVWGEEESRE
jgi:hypothetical protein